MDAFDPNPPAWTQSAVHTHQFQCPTCHAACGEAKQVWVNRRSPVFMEDYRRKWQEFYQCTCGCVWWAWSNDRPPNEYADRQKNQQPPKLFNPFDD